MHDQTTALRIISKFQNIQIIKQEGVNSIWFLFVQFFSYHTANLHKELNPSSVFMFNVEKCKYRMQDDRICWQEHLCYYDLEANANLGSSSS